MRPLNAAVGLALALAGCGHSAPPAAPESGSSRPFAGGSPRRLTFNLGDDRAPAWLPDGSGLLYSFQRLDRPDHDRCLGLLPPDGGRLERMLCDANPAADDSTNVLTEPAPTGDGRVAYLLVGSQTIDITPDYTAVLLGTLDGAAVRVLRTFPLKLFGRSGGIYLDVRNLLDRRNIIAVRRDTGEPTIAEPTLQAMAQGAYAAHPEPIPYESPRYRDWADLDHNGYVDGPAELMPLYLGAARDFVQPVFAYGPPRLVRVGVEVVF